MKNHLVFDRAALRELDRRAVEEFGIPILVLMENAGRAVAERALHHLPKAGKILIVAGPGNNGGDGLVAARWLHNAGVQLTILLAAPHEKFTGAAATQLAILEKMNLPAEPGTHVDIRDWVVASEPGDLVIDALFGTGLSRPVEGELAELIHAINAAAHAGRKVLAVDIPSGLDTDTGQPLGVAVHATETISFCGRKRGFANAAPYTGKVVIADIGAPRSLLEQLARPAS